MSGTVSSGNESVDDVAADLTEWGEIQSEEIKLDEARNMHSGSSHEYRML